MMVLRMWIAVVFLACLLPDRGYAQDKKVKTPEFHLKRAKRDRTIGLIAGAASAACLITGVIYDNKSGEGIGQVLGNGNMALLGYGGGLTFGLTSIGFFVGSGYHKRKAAAIQPIAYTNRLGARDLGLWSGFPAFHAGVAIRF